MKYRYKIFYNETIIYSNYLVELDGDYLILDTAKKQYSKDGYNWFKVTEFWD